jgi:predicted esterase
MTIAACHLLLYSSTDFIFRKVIEFTAKMWVQQNGKNGSPFILAITLFACLPFSYLHAQQTAKISAGGTGYLEYLPQDYGSNTRDYPIVIFLHGIGERGSTSTDPTTLKNSVLKVANVGLAKNVKYGAQYPFLLISPQLKSNYGQWPANYVMEVLNHVKKYLRVDERRIYITGLSLGGFGCWTTLGAYPEVFAASVPICSGGNALSKACAIAAENVALWAFHGTDDNIVSYSVTTKMINAVNACTPRPDPAAKYTLFTGLSHYIWDKVYKETSAIDWMLSFTNGTTATTTNNPPVVSAGSDKSLTLPTDDVYIQGTASDPDGTISTFQWTKTSGTTATLGGTTSSKLHASNLLAGSYNFRLTVKDDKGASKYDDVKVTVSENTTTTNVLPVASAGADKTITLPTNSITLNGSGTDQDGKIVSYKWTKYYGGNVTLTNTSSPSLTISNLTEGKYLLKLTVTDDKGATGEDNMSLIVNAATSTSNVNPVANAGANKTITLPTNSITLTGSGTDQDGKIVSYKWTQSSGPTAATITNATSSSVTFSKLTAGQYYIKLTVTDDKGASASDLMQLIVNKSTSTTANLSPVSNAGPNRYVSASFVKLYGSGSDKDGKIVSYKWTKYSGADITLQNSSTSTATVSGLKEGKYYLKLTVKDDDGALDYDNMLLVVEEG